MSTFARLCAVTEVSEFSLRQLAVLELACGELSGQSNAKFAEATNASAPAISRAVVKLYDAGMLKIDRDPTDLRRVCITGTKSARTMVERIARTFAEAA